MALFKEDLNFLEKYHKVIVLKDASQHAQVIICPDLQSKVMTSTAEGQDGRSLGFINYELIASQQVRPDMNPVGGEDRFWLGPEGGQYALFFKRGEAFSIENAVTPSPLDREPFEILSVEEGKAIFRKRLELENYSGTKFKSTVIREIHLMSREECEFNLNIQVAPGINYVGFESNNLLINTGANAWSKETGLLSVWILGMFPPSDEVTCFIPYKDLPKEHVEEIVNDRYFGKVPQDRLKVTNGFIYFRGDGKFRSKIGISFSRIKPILGSYDSLRKVLTIVQFSFPEERQEYVNSMWEIQSKPFEGDVINCYNDGGDSGPGFYELESSSPAIALRPSESIRHFHRTYHFTGSEEALDTILTRLFQKSLNEIKSIFTS